jgi:PAS domain S-box-containing protein
MGKDKIPFKGMSKPRKRAKPSLQEREKNFRVLAENANDGILIATSEGNHVYANKRAAEITGYSVPELFEISMRELAHPDELPKLSERLRKRLAGKRVPTQYETVIIRKDGQTVPVEITAALTVWQSQTADLVLIRDIADRKRTEKALQESEERYRRITEAVTDYIYTVRIQNGCPVETIHSPACVAVTGYTAEEFLRNPYLWIEMVYEDDRKLVRKLVADILSGFQVKPLEHRIIRKDGTLCWVRNTSVLYYDDQGKLVSYDGLIQDITERKQMEIALEEERASFAQKFEERTEELSRANAELARAARLKDEFLAIMSHELRTPLNVVLGMSEALQDGIYGPLNERQLNALRRIGESGHHLLAIITDILDLSQISTGRIELDIGPVAVESVCQAGLRFINQEVQKKRLTLSFEFDRVVTTIRTDGRRLKQALVNLLDNAVKFTPEEGKIGLEVEGDPENRVVRFTVWDTGIGIAKEDMNRLFQPFMQLDSSLSRKYEGTGLGLILVYRIVDLLGGGVSVESEVGKGSRFTILLPWKE